MCGNDEPNTYLGIFSYPYASYMGSNRFRYYM